MSEEYNVGELLIRIEELELAAIPVDDRMEKLQAAYEKKINGLLEDICRLRAGRYNWRTYDGTDATLPGENVECVVWPEWKQRNKLAPVELNLYHENGAWVTEEDERIDSVRVCDKWIPWKELWV